MFTLEVNIQGFIQQFGEKSPGQKLRKMINLTSKLGKLNDINISIGAKFILKIKFNFIVLSQAQVFRYHSDMSHRFS